MNEIELWRQFVQQYLEIKRLAEQIERIIGRSVEMKPFSTPHSWGFEAPKNFAFPSWQKRKNRLWIQVEKQWADSAGVSKLANHSDSTGVFGRPAVYWEVRQSNVEERNKVAVILAKVWEARHH